MSPSRKTSPSTTDNTTSGHIAGTATAAPDPPATKIFSIDDFPVVADRHEEFPALEVPVKRTAELRKKLSHVLLRKPRTPNVYKRQREKQQQQPPIPSSNDEDKSENGEEKDQPNDEKRVLVLSGEDAAKDGVVLDLLDREGDAIQRTSWTLTWSYEQMTTEEVLRAVLPDANAAGGDDGEKKSGSEIEIPTAFESVGTIAHINLRSDLLPYKYWIGKVLLDKNSPGVKTVVNKVGTIETEYRTFGMEVIAGYDGNGWSIVTAKEEGSTFEMDFTKVYWNSRLAGEHRRLVNLIRNDCIARKKNPLVVADLMAGIGPFAVPLTRQRQQQQQQGGVGSSDANNVVVHANDLNPDSYKWLVVNSQKNNCCDGNRLHCYNMDAREFVRRIFFQDRIQVDHVIMNLPATAPEFLDAFRGYDAAACGSRAATVLPRFHVHCFAPKESEKDGYPDAVKRCSDALGCELGKETGVNVRAVRNVAPKKNMVCVSFELPKAVRDVPSIFEDVEGAGANDTGALPEPDSKRIKTS